MKIFITSGDSFLTSERIKERLETLDDWDGSIQLNIQQSEMRLRSIEPTILVAIVSAAGTAFGALVAGLLQIAQTSRKEKITLVFKSGERIEVEGRNPKEKIEELVKLVKSEEPTRIIV